ncbi:LacI family DNA-binding transcriptional regulator [Paenibacillus cymbidii]|uniref:LacI family DNA-binding transcriptional regulator n=1 Tax=Paenibacillus cymbidii TaxID=1639034 RepID=UPI001080BB35|nr:LacI family DNA-binding transcriptional regulator [Paenibacillus cymbidii]
MKPTLKDVAKLAGVSIGTASKVVNGEGNVRAELQEKVWEAVRELHYLPNAVARSLKSASTRTIAVLLADITNPFQMSLAKGIEDVTYDRGYQLLISSTREDPAIERQNLRMLHEKRVDGIIVCTTGKVNEDIRALIESGIPVVLVDRPVPSLSADSVADNNMLGMELLVGHLAERGHRRIGIVHGDLNSIHGQLRCDGIAKAMAQRGLDLPPEREYLGRFAFDGGREAVEAFSRLAERPTAIISANNNMTAGILSASRDKGIRIPEDWAVVSFGELEYNWNLITPTVTAVSQAPLAIGRKAAELVLARLLNGRSDDIAHVLLTPSLRSGESSP